MSYRRLGLTQVPLPLYPVPLRVWRDVLRFPALRLVILALRTAPSYFPTPADFLVRT